QYRLGRMREPGEFQPAATRGRGPVSARREGDAAAARDRASGNAHRRRPRRRATRRRAGLPAALTHAGRTHMPRARSSSGKRAAARPRGAALRKKLPDYEAKRDFAVTPEPAPGAVAKTGEPTFVVHKHDATRLHYDVRLEMDGALASWSVPKGPSYDPDVKRLAVQTEDHPLEYGSFEGRIPDGEYGAGDSLIWDRGVYDTVPPGQASAQRKKGHLHLVFAGEKLRGGWHLVRTRGPSGTKSNWILFKAKDE